MVWILWECDYYRDTLIGVFRTMQEGEAYRQQMIDKDEDYRKYQDALVLTRHVVRGWPV